MNGLAGLAWANVELTSRCNKSCWMCGRRKRDREAPGTVEYGDMPWPLVEAIALQLPCGVLKQLHWNGEPLLYPDLGQALEKFTPPVSLDTNGKLLVERAGEIIDNLDTLAVSVFAGDPEQAPQLEILREFLRLRGDRRPLVVARILGDVPAEPYTALGCVVARRSMHAPDMSRDYAQAAPPVPECGVCLEALHHLAIARTGDVSMCPRYDPAGRGVIGRVPDQTLEEIWCGWQRSAAVDLHLTGNRGSLALCRECEYWGIPTGGPT